jgi:ATP-dependent exoDNAse (exonuclease V) beta subunit
MRETDMTASQRAEADGAARTTALDVRSSFIVQAPAGSGKTALLTQRFLALLATVDAPEEIIAITFTRKAAAEMRVRIMQALILAAEQRPVSGFEAQTRGLADAVLARDRLKEWSLMDQPARLRIMTIDALNGWIVRQIPWISGMGASPVIADDADELYRGAVRNVLLSASPNPVLRERITRLLTHLDNRYQLIEDLLVQMLGIRDQWVGLLSGDDDVMQRARGYIESTLAAIIEEHCRRLEEELLPDELREISSLGRHAATRLQHAEEREAGALSVFLEEAQISPGIDADLRRWLGAAQLLLTGQDQLRSKRGITQAVGFETKDPEKQRMIALLERMEEKPDFVRALGRVRGLPAPRFSDSQWSILSSILEVLDACATELRTQFIQRGTVDHAEVAASALRALGSDLEPSDLAMLLEYRIQHLLVDEFQDTSAGQFRLLRLLTAGWMPDDGHTLFLVGDPMQSIYRFREAEVGLFLRIWEDGRIGSVPLHPLRLYRNFRSQEGIVTWVNDAFSHIMPLHSDPETGAVAFVASTPTRPPADQAVSFHPVMAADHEAEARTVLTILRELGFGPGKETAGVEAGETAILVRSRAHLAAIIPQLRRAGIPFQAVEIESLAAHPAVQDVLAIARALLHSGDRTAWLAVLRAPFCGLQLQDLLILAADDGENAIPDRIVDAKSHAACSADARPRLARVGPVLADARRLAGRRPLRALVESCWVALGGPACVDTRGFEAVHRCLAMIGDSERGGGLDNLGVLSERLESLYAPPDSGAARRLQVMTIHKAKGLQFDNVILPRLDGPPRGRDERLLIWLENAGARKEDFLIAPLKERGADTDRTYRYVQHMLAEKEQHEYQRLLYVAATRARTRVFLTATLRSTTDPQGNEQLQPPRARSFLAALWPMLETRAAEALSNVTDALTGHDAQADSLARRLPVSWTPPPPPAPLGKEEVRRDTERVRLESAEFPWEAGEHARLRGVAVHRLLAHIGAHGIRRWEQRGREQQRETAVRILLTLSAEHSSELSRQVLQAVDQMLSDDMGRWLLSDHSEAESEWAVTGIVDGRKEMVILDRTFVDDEGTRWIVDFKSAEHEGAGVDEFLDAQLRQHAAQLQKYSAVMRAYDGRPQRLLLYFPTLRAWREQQVTSQGLLPPSS